MLQVSKSLPNFFLCNRPLHNAPFPAVSSAPLASDPKRWLQPNPNVLSISCQKTCRCCVWSKPVYFKIDGLWFWWEKTHPKVKAVFWDTGPCVDNVTGLQLVLSCPLWSDWKGNGQFTSQGGWNGFQLAKAISNPDTSSLSPAVVQVLSRPKPRWSWPLTVGSARLHPALHRTVRN